MKNQKIRNIIILIIVAIIFGIIGYLIPHKVLHHKGKRNVSSSTISSKGKTKSTVFIQEEGNISNITAKSITINGINININKNTKIYRGNSLENLSTLQNGVTISVIGLHSKNGIIAKFIIVI